VRRGRHIAVLAGALLIRAVAVLGGVHRWHEITAGPRPPAAWVSWAMLDRHTDRITGSANLGATNTSESTVKAWIAADDLRRLAERSLRPDNDELAALSVMVRDSDDRAAEAIYWRNGGDDVIARLVSVCGLTDTTVHPHWWSLTNISARDAVRMGECIADGRAAGPQWTPWLLAQMRKVRGEGRFGIVSALPAGQAATLAIKNGWTLHDPGDGWSVNCLTISDGWVLAVEIRYPPVLGGLAHGAQICAEVTRQHVAQPPPDATRSGAGVTGRRSRRRPGWPDRPRREDGWMNRLRAGWEWLWTRRECLWSRREWLWTRRQWLWARRQRTWRRLRWWCAGLVGAALVLAGGGAVFVASVALPPQPVVPQASTIYYSDGRTVLARVGITDRTDVPLAAVPEPVRLAVLAAEDRDFYGESAISFRGVLRAIGADVFGTGNEGASTITQQYVRNAFL
jgi:hypothetical protein